MSQVFGFGNRQPPFPHCGKEVNWQKERGGLRHLWRLVALQASRPLMHGLANQVGNALVAVEPRWLDAFGLEQRGSRQGSTFGFAAILNSCRHVVKPRRFEVEDLASITARMIRSIS